MKDKHNVMPILVSSIELNSLFRRLIKFLISIVSSSIFPGDSTFFNYFTTDIHLNRYKDSPGVFNFSFFISSFYFQSSSWRLNMVVRQGFFSFFNLFFKFSLEVKVRQTIRQLFFTVHSKSAVLPILAFEVVLCHS